MTRFTLFGAYATDLAGVVEASSAATGWEFEARESEYLEGEYFRAEGEGIDVNVQANFTDDEGYLIEPDFGDFASLVYLAQPDLDDVDYLGHLPDLRCLRVTRV